MSNSKNLDLDSLVASSEDIQWNGDLEALLNEDIPTVQQPQQQQPTIGVKRPRQQMTPQQQHTTFVNYPQQNFQQNFQPNFQQQQQNFQMFPQNVHHVNVTQNTAYLQNQQFRRLVPQGNATTMVYTSSIGSGIPTLQYTQQQQQQPKVMNTMIPSTGKQIDVTAKIQEGKVFCQTFNIQNWPKFLGEFKCDLRMCMKINVPNPKLKAFVDLLPTSSQIFVYETTNGKEVSLCSFSCCKFVGYIGNEYYYLCHLARAKLISLNILLSKYRHDGIEVRVQIYLPKKIFVKAPLPGAPSSEEAEAALEKNKSSRTQLKKLFDLLEKQNGKEITESVKVETKPVVKTEVKTDVKTENEEDDLKDIDDDLDEYIDVNAQTLQHINEEKERQQDEAEFELLYQKISQPVEDIEDVSNVVVPERLKLELREYQKMALKWMSGREKKGQKDTSVMKLHPLYSEKKFPDGTKFYYNPFAGSLTMEFVPAPPDPKGGILADEMGLGKTIEILSLMCANPSKMSSAKLNTTTNKYETKCTLIVCPLTLVDQWKSEIEKHTDPPMKCYVYQGPRRIRDPTKLMLFDAIVTTYPTMSHEFSQLQKSAMPQPPNAKKRKYDQFPLYQMTFHRVVLDEAHNIKNRKSLQTRAAVAIDSARRWAVTGTPIQNHIDDLFSLFHFVKVNPHGDWRWWSKNIGKPFEKKKTEAIGALQSVMQELLLRRTKNKKIKGERIIVLPEKHVSFKELEFSQAERALYDSLYEYSRGKFEEFVKENSVLKNYANIFEMLLHLRQVCGHPALLLISYQKKKDQSSLKSYLTQFCSEANEKIYKSVLPMLPTVLKHGNDVDIIQMLEDNYVGSAKVNALVSHLKRIQHETKSVVFSQWTTMLDVVEIALEKAGVNYVRLDGTMTRKDRDTAINTFKFDKSIPCCLFSLKAGGFGLNLTQATHVFLLDPWWNPAIEEQAINRVHRIGQKEQVTVVRYVIKNSVEQRILKLQQTKTKIVEGLNLSDEDTGDMSFGISKKDMQQIRLDDLHQLFNNDDEDYDPDNDLDNVDDEIEFDDH